MVTMKTIADGLRQIGIQKGDVLLVHSSLKSLGRVAGGADTVINALIDTIGPEGTLVMPAASVVIAPRLSR